MNSENSIKCIKSFFEDEFKKMKSIKSNNTNHFKKVYNYSNIEKDMIKLIRKCFHYKFFILFNALFDKYIKNRFNFVIVSDDFEIPSFFIEFLDYYAIKNVKNINFSVYNIQYLHLNIKQKIENYICIPYSNKKSILVNGSINPINMIPIGSGKFANVYEYQNNHNNKFVFKKIEYDFDELIGILYYYVIYTKLKNTNKQKFICSIYESGQLIYCDDIQKKYFYTVIEYGGITLKSYCEQNLDNISNINLTKMNTVFKIMLECAKAVQVIHNLNLVHLDIKLDNFLITSSENGFEIKIIDFGFMMKEGNIIKNGRCTADYCIENRHMASMNHSLQIIVKKIFDIESLCFMMFYLLFGTKSLSRIYFNIPTFSNHFREEINDIITKKIVKIKDKKIERIMILIYNYIFFILNTKEKNSEHNYKFYTIDNMITWLEESIKLVEF